MVLIFRAGWYRNLVHDVTVSNNQVSDNFNRGIIINGGTETVNAILNGIDVLSNSVRSNGTQGILVTGGTLSENATISDVLSMETPQTATAAEEFKQRAELPCQHFLP